MIQLITNLTFWIGIVVVTLSGIKLTVLPNTEISFLGVACFTLVLYFLDKTSKPSVIIYTTGEGNENNPNQNQ